jgi:hypothetical protein
MENDSSRNAAFAAELEDCEYELQRLTMATMIPDNLKDIKLIIYCNAFGVLEGVANLVAQQLSYLATRSGKLGRAIKMVFTEIQEVYKAAGEDFKKALAAFNTSLHDANLLIGISSPRSTQEYI